MNEEAIRDAFERARRLAHFEAAVAQRLKEIGMPVETFAALMQAIPEAGSVEAAGAKLNIDPAVLAAFMAMMTQMAPMFLKLLGM